LSALASIIAVNELLHSANNLISITYRPLEIYTCVAVIYMVLVMISTYASKKIESKLLFNIAKSKENLKKIAWWEAQC
jgi:polar amino acid transport system permease protein